VASGGAEIAPWAILLAAFIAASGPTPTPTPGVAGPTDNQCAVSKMEQPTDLSQALLQGAKSRMVESYTLYQPKPSTQDHSKRDIEGIVIRVALEEDLNPYLALALVEVESSLNPYAVSPAGAIGLAQMLPGTARRFGVDNPWDPEQNIRGGLRYLKFLLGIFDGDLRLALAAYNAGIPAVLYYEDVPPFGETKAFVSKVFRIFSERMFNESE